MIAFPMKKFQPTEILFRITMMNIYGQIGITIAGDADCIYVETLRQIQIFLQNSSS